MASFETEELDSEMSSDQLFEKPFLDDNSFEEPLLGKKRQWQKIYIAAVYLPALVLFLYSSLKLSSTECAKKPTFNIPSPVLDSGSVDFETKRFPQDFRKSIFAGEPSEPLDLAWHYLFEGNNIRVEKQDLDSIGLDSIELSDGGYIAQLGVFHELHCLKKIRHWIFKDYYVVSKNPSSAELREWPPHINHCLEMLRQSIMCKGDVSLSTFKWMGPNDTRFPTPWDRSPHRCVVWDSLAKWTKERSVNISQPGVLVDERGNPFP